MGIVRHPIADAIPPAAIITVPINRTIPGDHRVSYLGR
jgi:hypothetical protein